MRDELRTLVQHTVLPSPTPHEDESPVPVLVLDESGFPKRGRHCAGVAPQYCGRTGRVENCQVGVFLSYVTELGHALIDRELYLPDDWCSDLPRRHAAHIPETVSFQTKPELGQRMIERTQAAGLPIGWVVADTVYGHSTDLRLFLQEQDVPYAMAVPSIEVVCVQTRSGLLLRDVASIAKLALRARDWQRLSASMGTKGERLFDWARLPVLQAGVADGRNFLVMRRCLDDPDQLAYYLVFAPPTTPLSTMVQAIGARWHSEEDLETSKALGLDQYEVRSYLGWYRHLTLVMLASAFLVSICVQEREAHPVNVLRSASSAGSSDLSGSHVRSVSHALVALSAHPSVLGGLLSSSSPRQSQLSLESKPAVLCPENSQDFSGEFSSSPSLAFCRRNSQEFSWHVKSFVDRSCWTFHPRGAIR